MTVKFLRLWPWRMVCQLIFIIRRFCERNWNCIRNAFEGIETIIPIPFWGLLHSCKTKTSVKMLLVGNLHLLLVAWNLGLLLWKSCVKPSSV
jgi:hypothetical protein